MADPERHGWSIGSEMIFFKSLTRFGIAYYWLNCLWSSLVVPGSELFNCLFDGFFVNLQVAAGTYGRPEKHRRMPKCGVAVASRVVLRR